MPQPAAQWRATSSPRSVSRKGSWIESRVAMPMPVSAMPMGRNSAPPFWRRADWIRKTAAKGRKNQQVTDRMTL